MEGVEGIEPSSAGSKPAVARQAHPYGLRMASRGLAGRIRYFTMELHCCHKAAAYMSGGIDPRIHPRSPTGNRTPISWLRTTHTGRYTMGPSRALRGPSGIEPSLRRTQARNNAQRPHQDSNLGTRLRRSGSIHYWRQALVPPEGFEPSPR